MASERTDLQIIIEAIDKATKNLEAVKKGVLELGEAGKKAGSSVEGMGTAAKTASGSFKRLTAAVGLGNIAAIAATKAIELLLRAIRSFNSLISDSVKTAAEYEATFKGLSSVAVAYGFNVDKVREASIRLSEDGLLAPTEAAAALKNILAGLSGVTLEQAESLVKAMKDTASYNRILTDFGDSVVVTTKGMRNRNSILTDSAGVQKNLSVILMEHGFVLQDLDDEGKKAAATQALINGYLRESAFAAGDASEYTGTYQGKVAALNRELKETKRAIGESVIPVFEALKRVELEALLAIKQWISEHGEQLKRASEQLALLVLKTREAVLGIINAFKGLSVVGGIVVTAFAAAKVATIAYALVTTKALIPTIVAAIIKFKALAVAAWTAAAGVIASLGPVGWAAIGLAVGGTILGIKNDFLGMTTSFENAWGNFKKMFSLGVDDMSSEIPGLDEDITNWLDSIAEGTEEVSEGAKEAAKDLESYMHSLERGTKAYEQSLEDLVIAHKETWKDIKEQIYDEKRSYQESIKDRERDFIKAMRNMAESHEEKTKSILDDIADERKATQDEINDIAGEWNSLIELTTGAGEDRLSNLQAQLDKEVALGGGANQDKINALEELIRRENSALDEALGEQAETRDEEIQEVQNDLDEKLADLQAELDKENTLYERSVQEKREDYELDLANYRENNERKLEDLEEKLSEEEEIRERYAKDFKKIGDQMAEDDITRLKRKNEEELEEMAYQYEKKISSYKGYLEEIETLRDASIGGSEAEGAIADRNLAFMNRIHGFQHGGVIAKPSIVGEKGYPEVVLPLSEPQRMNNILKSLGISGGGGSGTVEQHFHIVVNRQSDVDMIMERAAFNMKYK